MLPEEILFGSSTESNSETDDTSVTNQAPNLDTNIDAATNQVEPTRVAEAIAPVTETTRAVDLEATNATDDVIEQENSSAQDHRDLADYCWCTGGHIAHRPCWAALVRHRAPYDLALGLAPSA